MDLDAGMDLLQGVQEADAPSGVLPEAGDFQMPSLEKMMEMLEHLDMSDEDKIELKKSLLQRGDILGKFAGLGQEATATPGGSFDPSTQFLVFFIAVALIAFVFVFFGYKLYKSLVEKEKKREDKKKQKMQKKKK